MKINMRPGGMIFRFGIAALAATAACTVCRAQTAVELPNGVKAVWDMSKAYVEKTPTRERFCINGLWRWQPATDASPTASVPTSNWGYFKVPGSWPGNYDGFMRHDSQTLYVHPAWKDVNVGNLTAAWYQREISIPIDWSWLRRIELSTEYLYSFAAVYVDGKQVGEMRFPAGSVNLDGVMPPGTTHTLSMLVIALPLSATMISNSDTAMAKQVKGVVERCGLCGNVWLSSKPQGPSLGDVKVETSVRKWEITFDAGIDGPDTAGPYCLRAEVSAEGLPTREFTSKLFTMGNLNANGRFAFTAEWKPEKLWDTDTPQNLYKATLTLLGREGVIDTRFPPPKPIAKGEPGAPWALDIFPPVRFGFREFWINGRDFYLNGNRITVSAEQMQNAAIGPGSATYDAAKETFLRLQSCGCNFVFGGNYGCAPGVHLSFEEILRAADDVGMLVALSQPHDRQYTWTGTDADNNNGYAPLAQFYTHVAGNHPSVIAYAMSHNGWSYVEFHNPDLIDGIKDPRYWTQQRDAAQALEAEAIVKHYDTSRVIYHHSCGDLGSTYTMNFYPNFTPMQEPRRLVHALVHSGSQAALRLRVRRAVHVGLRHVPRLVRRPPQLWQRRGPLGAVPRPVERAVLRRLRLPARPGRGEGPPLGERPFPRRRRLASLGLPLRPRLHQDARPVPDHRRAHYRQPPRLSHPGRLRRDVGRPRLLLGAAPRRGQEPQGAESGLGPPPAARSTARTISAASRTRWNWATRDPIGRPTRPARPCSATTCRSWRTSAANRKHSPARTTTSSPAKPSISS